MNRSVLPIIIGSLVLPPRGAPAQLLQPSELCSEHSASALPTFEDRFLEARIRRAVPAVDFLDNPLVDTRGPTVDVLGNPLGDLLGEPREALTCGMLSDLTELNASRAHIESLAGIQNLTNLTSLYLDSNLIIDISPLSGLTSLTKLQLQLNHISDVSPLSGLTGLTDLSLDRNSIRDISPLGELTGLKYLRLQYNYIADISALSGLTELTLLQLHVNSITDVGALSGLESLTHLYLGHNPGLTDIQSLLAMRGLAGGFVRLTGTAVNCTDVAALRARRVTVADTCLLRGR